MKEIIFKWLEIKRIKYEKLYCKHRWKELGQVNNRISESKLPEGVWYRYSCKKCGQFEERYLGN